MIIDFDEEKSKRKTKGLQTSWAFNERVIKFGGKELADKIRKDVALEGFYKFAEAGEGKHCLRSIIAAFENAVKHRPNRDLKHSTDRTMLANHRLAGELRAAGFGQMVCLAGGKNNYRVYFAPEQVSLAATILNNCGE